MIITSRYASEVDIDFVRKAVRSIGRITIKVEEAADACIHSLLDLIETKVSYVVQEAIIVIKDIFRRYPGRYEGIIPKLCENLDVLDEPEAKASMVWVIGQFANRIDNADDGELEPGNLVVANKSLETYVAAHKHRQDHGNDGRNADDEHCAEPDGQAC